MSVIGMSRRTGRSGYAELPEPDTITPADADAEGAAVCAVCADAHDETTAAPPINENTTNHRAFITSSRSTGYLGWLLN